MQMCDIRIKINRIRRSSTNPGLCQSFDGLDFLIINYIVVYNNSWLQIGFFFFEGCQFQEWNTAINVSTFQIFLDIWRQCNFPTTEHFVSFPLSHFFQSLDFLLSDGEWLKFQSKVSEKTTKNHPRPLLLSSPVMPYPISHYYASPYSPTIIFTFLFIPYFFLLPTPLSLFPSQAPTYPLPFPLPIIHLLHRLIHTSPPSPSLRYSSSHSPRPPSYSPGPSHSHFFVHVLFRESSHFPFHHRLALPLLPMLPLFPSPDLFHLLHLYLTPHFLIPPPIHASPPVFSLPHPFLHFPSRESSNFPFHHRFALPSSYFSSHYSPRSATSTYYTFPLHPYFPIPPPHPYSPSCLLTSSPLFTLSLPKIFQLSFPPSICTSLSLLHLPLFPSPSHFHLLHLFLTPSLSYSPTPSILPLSLHFLTPFYTFLPRIFSLFLSPSTYPSPPLFLLHLLFPQPPPFICYPFSLPLHFSTPTKFWLEVKPF